MKRTLLFLALALAAHGARAIEPAAKAVPAPKAAATASATAAASASDAGMAAPAAKAEAARKELADLRQQMQGLTRRMAELSSELGDVGPRAYAFRYIGESDRAMIGKLRAFAEAHIPASARNATETAIANIEYRLKVREQRMPAIDAWLQKHGG